MALEYRRFGYSAACCLAVELKWKALIKAVGDALRKNGVVIAEVGRWVNLLDPNPKRCQAALQLVIEGFALEDEVGALCCVDIVGSYNQMYCMGCTPDNLSQECFDAAVENAQKIRRSKAQKGRVLLRNDGLDDTRQPRFVPFQRCLELIGAWIAGCHAKDLRWVAGMNVHFG